jgi:hypothetical protein
MVDLPGGATLAGGPPASLLLVHGAGSGPWIFHGWVRAFPGIKVATVDLHAGIEVAGPHITTTPATLSALPGRCRSRSRCAAGAWAGWWFCRPASGSARTASSCSSRVPQPRSRASIGLSRSKTAPLIPKSATGGFRVPCDRDRSHRGRGPSVSRGYPCRRSRARRWSSTATNTGSGGERGSPACTTRGNWTSRE